MTTWRINPSQRKLDELDVNNSKLYNISFDLGDASGDDN